MKTIITLISLCFFLVTANAQSTSELVYNIMQAKCATSGCHNSNDQVANLDLQAGSIAEMRANLLGVAPQNATADQKHHQLIYPGDPYKSFLFRKINNGLAASDVLDVDEGLNMPPANSPQLTDYEKEIIRQWINFGAPVNGTVANTQLLQEFYGADGNLSNDDNGIWSIDPQNPPAPPEQGFQIHMGPFFLPPSSFDERAETEFYSKWDANNELPFEVTRINTIMGSSHHFIGYYCEDDCDNVGYGYRQNANFLARQWTAVQEPKDIQLPLGTAYSFPANSVLDLNSHYINFSFTAPLACEVYVNVHTQEEGVAVQEMFNELLIDFNFFIQNNGDTVVHEAPFFDNNAPTINVWQLGSHTHEKGVDFDVWLRNEDGSKGEKLLDASNYLGVPECNEIVYDYAHPPNREFSPFLPIDMSVGIIHRAKWVNNSDQSTFFGVLSTDEMMITTVSFTLGTEGVTPGTASACDEPPVGIEDEIKHQQQMEIYPNPFSQQATILLSENLKQGNYQIEVIDLLGKKHQSIAVEHQANSTIINLNRNELNNGVYFIKLIQNGETVAIQKVIVR